jgi:hypothetical protein
MAGARAAPDYFHAPDAGKRVAEPVTLYKLTKLFPKYIASF